MNICYLLAGFSGTGGIGRVTSILVNELQKNSNYKIFTLCYAKTKKEDVYELKSNITKEYLLEKKVSMLKSLLKGSFIKSRQYLVNNEIDILIACGTIYYLIAVISTIGLKTKVICWEHSNVQNNNDHAFQAYTRKFGAIRSNLIVTLTKHDKASFINEYGVTKVKQVYNPIDNAILDSISDYCLESKKIISVGRLSYPKNFENLIEVAQIIFKKHPDWEWHIYGEGELKDDLQYKINQYNIQNNLFLKGKVYNLYELYNEYSFLVMTSRYEGFPMTLLEGLANGLPLISYDVLTGPNEIITNNENGFLISPFDIEEMANKILELISNAELRLKISNNNAEKSKEYSLDSIVKQWEHIFEEMVNS